MTLSDGLEVVLDHAVENRRLEAARRAFARRRGLTGFSRDAIVAPGSCQFHEASVVARNQPVGDRIGGVSPTARGEETDAGKRPAAKKLMLGANALQGKSTATTVRVRNGKTQTTDGPFAETKEQLGGYYLVDCKDLDQAIEWAAKIPSAKFGSIEIRPIMHFG